ncbi:protein BANP-like isoform X2 [Gigantopelta aegis]|uniref:protein BANP-like isoform X2 n=1 Tax=Gigantopelta aegis TaxID=1735272 RepID=UPI001B88AD2A|nr:protein BANP-like isoform X2 [Gigantopelta aegis]
MQLRHGFSWRSENTCAKYKIRLLRHPLNINMTTVDCDEMSVHPRIIAVESSSVVTSFDDSNSMDEDSLNEVTDPVQKKRKLDLDEVSMDQSIKQILFNINKAICLRLDGIEHRLNHIQSRTKLVEEKVEQLLVMSRQQPGSVVHQPPNSRRGAVIIGLPQNGTRIDSGTELTAEQANQLAEAEQSLNSVDGNVQSLGPNVTLITLNTEDDFPSGTWLGDESNPEMRVRAPILPSDLLHIHSNCRTPEKMALTMLDYLFDRETQACSNLSGMGKHGKKQLDPLMIYGIRCHLIQRFGITENDWHRIKQNIDSKCRTAFRRKQKGMPLTVKAFRGKAHEKTIAGALSVDCQSDDDSMNHEDSELHIHQSDCDIHQSISMQGETIQQGEIQILHATPEQISQLQQAHHIQILQGDQVIGQIQHGDISALGDGIQVATVTTDSGEVLQIQQALASSVTE